MRQHSQDLSCQRLHRCTPRELLVQAALVPLRASLSHPLPTALPGLQDPLNLVVWEVPEEQQPGLLLRPR